MRYHEYELHRARVRLRIAVAAIFVCALGGLVGGTCAHERIGTLSDERDMLVTIARTRQASLERMARHCDAVRVALRLDEDDLRSRDASRQERAAWRFQTDALHSYWDVRLCDPIPPDLRRRDACTVRHDYPCLAELAHRAMAAVETP